MDNSDKEYIDRLPNVPLKYVFNTWEETLIDDFDDEKFEVTRGGSHGKSSGLKARTSEIQSSFLKNIKKYVSTISDNYYQKMKKSIGEIKFEEYKNIIYDYCHHKDEMPETVNKFISLLDSYFEYKNYTKYYLESNRITPSEILTTNDINTILNINADFFEKIYKECEDSNAYTFIHRGIKEYVINKYFPKDIFYEKNLLSSYSFSYSLPESFSGHHQKGFNIPVMIGAIAEECSNRVIGIPMLFQDFKEFHYDSFEIILIPPLTLTKIYQDIDMDGTLEYITLLENGQYREWYLSSIFND